MKKLLLLTFLLAFSITGCASQNVQQQQLSTKSAPQAQQPQKYYSISSDDRSAAIEINAPAQQVFDGVTIEPARAITAALSQEIASVSSRFSTPEEKAGFRDRPKSEWADYNLGVSFGKSRKSDGNVLVILAVSQTQKDWFVKVGEAKTYELVTDINISCAGDTLQTCSKKLADSVIGRAVSVVKRFVKDLGY
jgi:hypothetical protein